MSRPSVAVVVPAYNAARWIEATLESVLAQSEPAEEVIVIDDGSSDDTVDRARRSGSRVVSQPNGGAPSAYNHGFRLASSEYVAMCPADDLWHPDKLRWQRETVRRHAQLDVIFGAARHFGDRDTDYPRPSRPGLQDPTVFGVELFELDVIPAPTVMIRRALHVRLGAFREDLPSEDYEFWLRALQAGAAFFFDDRVLAHLRLHGGNLSQRAVLIREMDHLIHRTYADMAGDRERVERILARDLRSIGRGRLGLDDARGASRAYRGALRHEVTPAGLAWAVATSLPGVDAAVGPLNRWRQRRR